MKTKLNVKEILALPALLPKKGNIITQTLVKDLRNRISLTQEEMKLVGLTPTSQGLQWKDKEFTKEVDISEVELTMMRNEIDSLDKTGEINQDILDLCVKMRELKETPTDEKPVRDD
jgi:hypothetical protein